MDFLSDTLQNLTPVDAIVLIVLFSLHALSVFTRAMAFHLMRTRRDGDANLKSILRELHVIKLHIVLKEMLVTRGIEIPLMFFSLILLFLYYVLTIFLIVPYSKTLGIALIILLVLREIHNSLYAPFLNLQLSYGGRINIVRLKIMSSQMFSLLITFSILFLAFNGAIKLSEGYDFSYDLSSELNSIKNQYKSVDKNILELKNSLGEIESVIASTLDNVDALATSLEVVHENLSKLDIEKHKLEKRVQALESMTEEEIKNHTIYVVLSKLLSERRLSGIFIAFFVGFFASFVANRFSTGLRKSTSYPSGHQARSEQ